MAMNGMSCFWLKSTLGSLTRFVAGFLLGSILCGRVIAAEVAVEIVNPPTTGKVVALLFNTPNTFLNLRDPVRVLTLEAVPGHPSIISGVPAGRYALVAYADVNGNGRLDKNFIGIPREPLGFSNRYEPKGPPVFTRAEFTVEEGITNRCDVSLRSSFGKAGLFGVGVGVITKSSPYTGSDQIITQPIPAISYIGDRLQILGPGVRYGLLHIGDLRLAASANYRIGAYSEDDSPVLAGLGDREGTLMGGLAIRTRLPFGVQFSCGYDHDLLDRFNGGIARVGFDKGFQRGILTVSPILSLNWISSELANYEFGVPAAQGRVDRPAYEPGEAITIAPGLAVVVELSRAWRLVLSGSTELLPSSITDSPIVGESQVISGFSAITRLF